MPTNIQHLLPFTFGFLQIVTIVFLAWLYRRTRLPSVLIYLIWRVVNLFQSFAWIIFSTHALPMQAELAAAISNVLAMFGGAVSTGLLIWMLISLVNWARPSLPRQAIAPGEVA